MATPGVSGGTPPSHDISSPVLVASSSATNAGGSAEKPKRLTDEYWVHYEKLFAEQQDPLLMYPVGTVSVLTVPRLHRNEAHHILPVFFLFLFFLFFFL